jgi:phosphoribosylanthranilate isomerase
MFEVQRGKVVKICGLRSVEAARAAAFAGADALGFVLAESRRQVRPVLIREVREALAIEVERVPVVIGVTVNATAAEVAAIADEAALDLVQLSGDEEPGLLEDLVVPSIKTIHVAPGTSIDDLCREIDRWFDHARPVVAVLIDAKVDGAYGGSGVQSDWSAAAQVAERYPAILAGGLKPGNVFESIHVVRPRGVDVSSGVEIAGEKDLVLIEAFIAHARQGFDGLLDEPERV